MKEWLEVIRDTNVFNLLVDAKEISITTAFDFKTITGNINVQYESLRSVKESSMPNPPNFIAVSDVHTQVTSESSPHNLIPHAADPAPAQRAGNVAFIWGKCKNGKLRPFREDGFPAVVLAVGLSKHYQYGKLTRKGQHPAIKAERLAALWYDYDTGDCYRNNGPSSIAFECYKEFWIDGEYKGQRWADFKLDWKHRLMDTRNSESTLNNYLGDLKGTTNMFSDAYFVDDVDELCYMTDFA
jgi:hypothetical protein